MANHAERFVQMTQSFQKIVPRYKRVVPEHAQVANYPMVPYMSTMPYLHVHLRAWVSRYKAELVENRSGSYCYCLVSTRGRDDGRRPLPNGIYKCLKHNKCSWVQKTVTITWIVAYLDRLQPDCMADKWINYQLSHRCLGAGMNRLCIVPDHMVWESASLNQSRGYRWCMVICHCGCGLTVCAANDIHNKQCL